ncbi:MAG: SWIM zinc finger family protein [Wolbachia sp.]|nr:SWIM zinc finger family protein [Wolbachia sp.]MDD9336703.1 SWIM zinc finger family protein [Wolbachia sp.]
MSLTSPEENFISITEWCTYMCQFDGKCSCPAFENFGPCEHVVTTAFSLIQHSRQGCLSSDECSNCIDEQDRFERLLLKKTKQELVVIILHFSSYYPKIRSLS